MKKLSGVLAAVALSISAGAFAADTSVRGISLGDDSGEAKSKLGGKVASAEMQAARKLGLNGFVETMGKTDDYELRYAARPDGSIYRIRYAARVPMAEMAAIRDSLCQNFDIRNAQCSASIDFAPQDPRRKRSYFEAAGLLGDGGNYRVSIEPIVTKRNALAGKNYYHKTDAVLKIEQLAEAKERDVYKKWKQAQASEQTAQVDQKKASKSYY